MGSCQTLRYYMLIFYYIRNIQNLTIMFVSFQYTLRTICDHTNNISLSDSRAHRNRKRKNEHYNQGGSFGTPSASPINKKGKKRED